MSQDGSNIKIRDSLRFRLSASIGIAVMFTLIISSAIFSWISFTKDIELEIGRIKSVTSVLSNSIAEDMAIENRHNVLDGLTSIRAFNHLEYASVTKTDGTKFAEMGFGSFLLMANIDLKRQSPFELLFRQKIWVETPIVRGGKAVGKLHILSNISHLRHGFFKSLLFNLLVAISTMTVAVLISLRSVGRIVKPVSQLSHAMLQAGQSGEFSQRLTVDDKGEVGVLAGSFNTMISKIETRDGQLKDYRTNLENKVELRTVELEVARDQAEKANAAKSDFLATMSHEIRTPMNGMMVMAEMLAAAPLNARHRRYANIISRSGAGLLGIINDILDFSKIEAGQLELEETRVEIDTLVGDVANLFWDKAGEKSLELVTQIARDVPISLIGDPTRIGQIVTNLVNNALKFTAKGGVLVKVSCKDGCQIEKGQKTCIRFEVTDTGIGIAPDQQATVFERFSQADQSTTRNYGGTGLGLSICQRLVNAMGGEIGLDSVPGKGSTFWFEIELAADEISAAAPLFANPVTLNLVSGLTLASGAMQNLFAERGVNVKLHEFANANNWDPGAIILGDARWIGEHREELKRCTVIAITAIGDTLSDQLIEDGVVVDLVRLPFARSEIEDLCVRIETKNYLKLDALEHSDQLAQDFTDFKGTKILAVDDNAVNREVLRDALGVLNVDVTLAESGEQAIELLQQNSFDLVFMDCSMPGIDGFEATRIIRKNEIEHNAPRTPVVALTAHVTGADAEKWRVSGMDGYLAKPFTIESLSSQIVAMREIVENQVKLENDREINEGKHPKIAENEYIEDGKLITPVNSDSLIEPDEQVNLAPECEVIEVAGSRRKIDGEAGFIPVENLQSDLQPANSKKSDENIVLLNQQTLEFIDSLGKSSSVNMASKIFGLYIEHAPAGIETILEAGKRRNHMDLAKSAHALKSMSLSAGAMAVGNCCQNIEHDANCEFSDKMQNELTLLVTLFDETIIAMQEHIEASEQCDDEAVA